jgi:nitrite reductase/ring-hydroxylating ferredoxin subunit
MKVKAAHVDEIAEGKSKCVKLDQLRILLIKQNGEIFALENRCPHFGLSMEKGVIRNGSITCPWHGSSFDVRTGANVDWVNAVAGIALPQWSRKLVAMGKQPHAVRTFPVSVENGTVLVDTA